MSMSDPQDNNLVAHARRELDLCGQTAEDPEYAASLVKAVEAFASYGHSGGSAMCAVEQLAALLRFQALSPLRADAAEWCNVAEYSPGVPLWQNRRDPAAFTDDPQFHTYWRVDEDGPDHPRYYTGTVETIGARRA